MPTTTTPTRAEILYQLRDFITQRPGLIAEDYATPRDYHRAVAEVTRDRTAALQLWQYIAHQAPDMGAEWLIEAAPQVYGGRLAWDEALQDWDYTEGQYFPAEYRRAAIAVMARALRLYWLGPTPWLTPAELLAMARLRFKSRRIWDYFR
jgi:hypothetical protein